MAQFALNATGATPLQAWESGKIGLSWGGAGVSPARLRPLAAGWRRS